MVAYKFMFLKRLRDLREDHDLKQESVANLLKITRQQYGLYETGKRTIPIDLLIILAKYYNVSLDYITGISDRKDLVLNEKEKVTL